jgi:alkanesulfonate monooxygenase SsuD/methylene tetrahydromethanopterin reductase-like flavin-dependent oxidoreductase (luciferase family)
MSGGLTFGVSPSPQAAPFEAILERAKRSAELGFDGLWFADETPMAYPGFITLDAWVLMGAIAREVPNVTLGTSVTAALYRHPLLNAMAVSSLDHVSGGRAILGMGAGGVPADLDGFGAGGTAPGEVVARLDEQLSTVDRLLRGERVTREDGFYPTRNAQVERPVQAPRPKLLVAAQKPRSIRVAARWADIWNTLGGQPIEGDRLAMPDAVAEVGRQIEQLEAACQEIGRDPSEIRRSVLQFRSGAFASMDAFEEWVGRMIEVGIQEFIFLWPGTPELDALLERFVVEKLPGIRARGPRTVE